MKRKTGVKAEGDWVIITMHRKDVHNLTVALKPCPCKGTKSNATENIRNRLCNALERVR